MADQPSAPGNPQTRPPESPGGKPMTWPGIAAVMIYLVLVAVVVVHGLVVLWPPNRPDRKTDGEEIAAQVAAALKKATEEGRGTAAAATEAAESVTASRSSAPPPPSTPAAGSELPGSAEVGAAAEGSGSSVVTAVTRPTAEGGADSAVREAATQGEPKAEDKATASACGDQEEAKFLRWTVCLSSEERLFLIVAFAGALGGLVHSLRSFYWYLGNRDLVLSWVGMYVTLPVVGAAMALVFYLVVRGGFTPSEAGASQTNPFGFAAMAVLVGMFTEQAALRLKDVAETFFTKARTGKDHAGPPAVTKVEPSEGAQAGGTEVTIIGSGFKEGAVVQFGGKAAAQVQVIDDTKISAKTPQAATPGPVAVEVVNPGGLKGLLPDGFTYA